MLKHALTKFFQYYINFFHLVFRNTFKYIQFTELSQPDFYERIYPLKKAFTPTGWFICEITAKGSFPCTTATITAHDRALTLHKKINLEKCKTAKRIIYLPFQPDYLTLNIDTQMGKIDTLDISFKKVTRAFADKAINKKLSYFHRRYQLPSSESLKLHERYAAYSDGFDMLSNQVLSYQQWIEQKENFSFYRQAVSEYLFHPVISIILPVYNTPVELLAEAIQSVQHQTYPSWQLCIADDASDHEDTRQYLKEVATRDSRIKLIFREHNGHISAASNSALALAEGEFIAFLDHDDLLSPHALTEVVAAINHHPTAKLLYSDEDKIDLDGNRHHPHFKPDWNPDLFYSCNYVSHFAVYRRDIANQIKGLREGFEGSQDYDFTLRYIRHLKPSDIVHIPKVLYHWRELPGSTAVSLSEKGYAHRAGLLALQDHFSGSGVRVTDGQSAGSYRLLWPLPAKPPLVSLLIPTRDTLHHLKKCVDSIIEKTSYPHYEILILDNQSVEPETLGYFASLSAHENIRIVKYDAPFNYSSINNYGAALARGEVLALVNNDIEVISPDWLTEMVRHAVRKDVGCVGAKLYYGNDTIQHAGVICGLGGINGVAGHSHKFYPREHPGYFNRLLLTQNLSAVTAACLLVKKSIYTQVSGLDEEHLAVAFNDVDFCLRVKEAGYRNIWTPYAELYHHESVSRGHEDTPEKLARFQAECDYMRQRWGERLRKDPAYSPNLTLDREDFSYG
ncbi:glycosyltransferase family 2 protein [Zobellella endophytica]|uniref:Glycosyltransferase family 2 protein n=1 Tax=Zobellella endophytica TaxID=2116700 RepID=A0A2P7RCT2_9GAMM|nr:glycosyltransferase family 2 protein [Zobellella endophytica]PSJ48035.1 glycosyltransferase family 2 protein [Zobellella endophytica]